MGRGPDDLTTAATDRWYDWIRRPWLAYYGRCQDVRPRARSVYMGTL
jgi:hypothetical protein